MGRFQSPVFQLECRPSVCLIYYCHGKVIIYQFQENANLIQTLEKYLVIPNAKHFKISEFKERNQGK